MTFTDDQLNEVRDALRLRLDDLAEYLLGKPNRSLSNSRELRYGSKGSLAVHIAGTRAGGWFDFEAGSGGDALALIQRERNCGFQDAVIFGAQFCGVALDNDVASLPPVRPREHVAAKREAKLAEAEAERIQKIANAQNIWKESKLISGTLADKYLVNKRKIPTPTGGWPVTTLRYNERLNALVVAATADNGYINAIQIIRLDRTGGKVDDGNAAKRSYGPQDGAWVRLPGESTGPLLLTEGPETGLSVWRATGYETWVALGSIAKIEPPAGRRICVCADDDPKQSDDGKPGPAYKTLQNTLERWRTAGHDIVVIYPWPVRRQDRSDFNDLMQSEGVNAVCARVNLSISPKPLTPHRLPLNEARAKLGVAIGDFFRQAHAYRLASPDEREAFPPVHAIRTDVGTGKSTATGKAAVDFIHQIRAQGYNESLAIFVPTHSLGDELAEKIECLPGADDLRVAVYRGREADDPDNPGEKMCMDLPAVKLVQEYGLDPVRAVCRQRKKLKDGTVNEIFCPFYENCGYQRQHVTQANIWITAHEIAFNAKPNCFGKLAAVVFDESFLKAGIHPEISFPIDLFGASASIPDDKTASDRLSFLRREVLHLLRKHPEGPLQRQGFIGINFTDESAGEGVALEWCRKVDPDMWPGMTYEARKQAAATASVNKQVTQLAGFWGALKRFLGDGGSNASGELRIHVDPKSGARMVGVKYRKEVAVDFRVSTLLLDATLRKELVTPFFPNVEIAADIAVGMRHQQVFQIQGIVFSKSRLLAMTASSTDEARRRGNRLAEVRSWVILQARRAAPGQVLVVLQQDIEAAFLAIGPLPTNVCTAHHNAVRGRDEWRDVAVLVVVGRTMPSPDAVESTAEALTGRALTRIKGWYERADAVLELAEGSSLTEGDCHPDPIAEAVRWQICEAELVQIIGRGRGVNRTKENPLEVWILTDVPIPVPITALLPKTVLDLAPEQEMLVAGGVALHSPSDASLAYPEIWKSAESAKKEFQRSRWGTNPYKIPLGKCPPPLTKVTYQKVGVGMKPAMALVDELIVANPSEWLISRLGPLSRCDVELPRCVVYANPEQAIETPDAGSPAETSPICRDDCAEVAHQHWPPGPTGIVSMSDTPPWPTDYIQPQPPAFFSLPQAVISAPLPDLRQRLNALHQRLEMARPPVPWGDEFDALKEAWWRQRMEAISGMGQSGSQQATA